MEFTEYHTRLAAYVLMVDEQERVLLAWWNGEGHSDPAWSLPGGELGTTEVGGSTDRAAWVPLAELEGQPRATIVDIALAAREARR
ncbi:hypothetical protein GCM10027062_08130 [Nocardioides hungaricus]